MTAKSHSHAHEKETHHKAHAPVHHKPAEHHAPAHHKPVEHKPKKADPAEIPGVDWAGMAADFRAASDDPAAVAALADDISSTYTEADVLAFAARCKEAASGDAVRNVAAEMAAKQTA